MFLDVFNKIYLIDDAKTMIYTGEMKKIFSFKGKPNIPLKTNATERDEYR